MENNQIVWTEEMVVQAFEEAVRTLKKLPAVKLYDYFSTWPEVVYTAREIAMMDQKSKKWPATSEAISRLERTCGWIHFLDEVDDRKIVWLRAKKTPWKLICIEFAISRATANRKWQKAIRLITTKLD